MRSPLGMLFVLAALAIASFGEDIRKGATINVKSNSIWFQDVASLTQWQHLKKSGNSKALAAYEEKELSNRDAWQFTNQISVKVLSYDSARSQANVEMRTPGRMLGTNWWLDAETLVR
jgi:hypothetical protein